MQRVPEVTGHHWTITGVAGVRRGMIMHSTKTALLVLMLLRGAPHAQENYQPEPSASWWKSSGLHRGHNGSLSQSEQDRRVREFWLNDPSTRAERRLLAAAGEMLAAEDVENRYSLVTSICTTLLLVGEDDTLEFLDQLRAGGGIRELLLVQGVSASQAEATVELVAGHDEEMRHKLELKKFEEVTRHVRGNIKLRTEIRAMAESTEDVCMIAADPLRKSITLIDGATASALVNSLATARFIDSPRVLGGWFHAENVARTPVPGLFQTFPFCPFAEIRVGSRRLGISWFFDHSGGPSPAAGDSCLNLAVIQSGPLLKVVALGDALVQELHEAGMRPWEFRELLIWLSSGQSASVIGSDERRLRLPWDDVGRDARRLVNSVVPGK